MFSLEGPEGKRFLTRSRLFSDEECTLLGIVSEPPTAVPRFSADRDYQSGSVRRPIRNFNQEEKHP